jgi:hypothetical protein
MSESQSLHRIYSAAGLVIRRKRRTHRVRESDPRAERGRCVHARVSGLGSGHDLTSRRETRVLEATVGGRGGPPAIRCDNGPELTSRRFLAWCVERQIELLHI